MIKLAWNKVRICPVILGRRKENWARVGEDLDGGLII